VLGLSFETMSTSKYTIALPKSVINVTSWERLELVAEAANRPETMLVRRYGGHVLEENNVIGIATDDKMTEEIDAKHASLPPLDDDEEETAEEDKDELNLGTLSTPRKSMI
jgi:hypothetical protein